MADIPAGTVLGERFEVVGVLGRGGMATVYLVTDRVRGMQVALKVLHAHLADQPGMQARLKREIEAASRLRHPAALVAWELHEVDGASALSMPFHPGRTLGEAVASGTRLDAEGLRSLGQRLASALAEAHAQGVLHGDVSPANVMLGEPGAALTDFGLARFQDRRTRRSTGMLGTSGYTAPEVYEGVRADPRSDLYGLGAVLYLAATGREPFAAENPVGVLQRQLEERYTPLEELRPDLPEALRLTITSLLRREPSRRPAGARELADALVNRRAPEDAQVAPVARMEVASHLPIGEWLVQITGQPPEVKAAVRHRKRRRKRRGRREGRTGLDQVMNQVDEALETIATGVEAGIEAGISAITNRGPTPTGLLTGEVALLAGLPEDGLRAPGTLEEKRFRLVDGVDESSAEALAGMARRLGYEAKALRARRLDSPWKELAELTGPMVGVMWVCFPFLIALFGVDPLILLPLMISLSILLPVVGSMMGEAEAREWPLAFGRDLRPLATEGVRQTLPPLMDEEEVLKGLKGLRGKRVEALPAPEPEPEPEAPEKPGLAHRAEQQIAALLETVEALSDTLPEPAIRDLRDTARQLGEQASALGEAAERIEAELEHLDAGASDAELGWVEDRLRRLETLERAGQTVDAGERARLQRALEAHRRALETTASLESQLTATLARLLEIATTAGQVRRELLARPDGAHTAELLGEKLRDEAKAAARASASVQALGRRLKS